MPQEHIIHTHNYLTMSQVTIDDNQGKHKQTETVSSHTVKNY